MTVKKKRYSFYQKQRELHFLLAFVFSLPAGFLPFLGASCESEEIADSYSILPCVDRLAGYARHFTFFLALLSCLPPLKELLLATEASWSSGDWSEST